MHTKRCAAFILMSHRSTMFSSPLIPSSISFKEKHYQKQKCLYQKFMKFTQHGLRPFTINRKKKSFLPLSNSSFFLLTYRASEREITLNWTKWGECMRWIRTVNIREENVNNERTSDGCCALLLTSLSLSHSNNSTNENKNCKACILYMFVCACSILRFSIPLRIFYKQLSFLFHSQPPSCESALQTTFQNYTTLACGWILCVYVCFIVCISGLW